MAYTTINKSTAHFNTKLYTGNGGTNAITGVGFQPDLVWIKDRDATGYHFWTDAVRGVTKTLYSNVTNAETTEATGLTAFGTDGFTVGSHGNINTNGRNIVSWNWNANGSGSANTDGSINSTVSANTTAGFSIVSYTGDGTNNNTATIGHGLGVAPSMIIVKGRNAAASWITTNTANGFNNVLELNSTAANAANTNAFGTTGISPTSTVFTVAAESGQHHTNTNNNTYIAYCFAEKTGYSKFGSYTGNGNADGTFVYTGFKPAFILCKDPNYAAENWFMFDNKRPGYNVNANLLYANDTATETTSGANQIDLLSNGFKMRATNNGMNRSGSTFIYMAFGQSIVGSNNVPCTAR